MLNVFSMRYAINDIIICFCSGMSMRAVLPLQQENKMYCMTFIIIIFVFCCRDRPGT